MTSADSEPHPGAAYLSLLRDRFDQASTSGRRTHNFEIGGVPIRFELAGVGLEPALTGALSHLRTQGQSSLVVQVWDGASTGVVLHPPPLTRRDFGPLGEILPFQNASIFAVFTNGILSVFDRDSGGGFCWIANAQGLPSWEYAAPIRSLLGAILRSRARHIVHGAAIGSNGAGALIVGEGGSGKSSTAMACFAAGMSYVGDDYCILSEDPEPIAHSLYSSAKLFPADASHVNPEDIRRKISGMPNEKDVLYLADRPGPRFPACLPLTAIFAPRLVDGAEVSVRPISPMRAVVPVLTSTAAQTPGVGGELFGALSRVARRVPCFELSVGSSRRRVAEVVRETLHRLA